MAKRTDRIRKDLDTEATAASDCPFCIKNEDTKSAEGARKRHLHYLKLAEDEGTDALKAHLDLYVHRWHAGDHEHAAETIHSTMAWVWDEIKTYSNLVDDRGGKLEWGEARRQGLAAMRQAYANIRSREHASRESRAYPSQIGTFSRITQDHAPYQEHPIDYEQRKRVLVDQAVWVMQPHEPDRAEPASYIPPPDEAYLEEPEES